ncbi:serine/threonine-protein kinase [Streptomyces erythrochromogenes]|uniref:serine/threonine-protein kinase n=1 Tax=Streptomyces erythrochromogenes TaxID=285574 RepID=UPI002253FEB6|nr:serine/threonine-protein kinase [Streptomyces erythrochromogenes]MCX5584982.1 protein kinase [Streptomyces erythrochromogenes]
MSKPEHTESPAGAPAAKLGDGASAGSAPASAPAAKPEDVSVPAARTAADAEPDGPEPVPASAPAAKPEESKPAASKPRLSKAAPAAEPEDAKPRPGKAAAAEPAPAPAAEPEDAKPRPGEAAAAESGADAKPEGSKPRLGKGVPAAAEPGSGKAAAAESGADAKPEDAKPAVKPVGATGANPVVEKADAVAAAVKAAAAKAAKGAHDEGRLLAGRYRLNAVLGKGGMGTVWRAQDETLGRTVAVKELRFSSGVDDDEKRRLITRTLREAKAIARIRSGGAVTVYDVVDEDARPWIVMELIEGPSLAEFIRENGPLTPHRAAEVGLAVLDVLRAAHGQGILHRDVKPSNVLIAGNGRVVLTDFGIAQVEGDPSVTSTGMLVGAPSYISPERARGQKPGPPADMWSLGGLLYASVEGTPPYDKGSALATLTAVMTEPVDPPKNAGPLTEVIYGLLAKDPARRLDEGRARAMLTAVIAAPEPVPAPVVPAVAEETRQISLADAKQAAEKATAEKAAEKAAKKERERREREQRERARAALKAARKATAAAAATATAASAAEAPKGRPASVVAPLTDVMPRRTIVLAVVAVVAVLAVVGSLIAWAISGDDKDKKDQGKGGQATPAASAPQTSGGAEQGSPKPSGNTGETGAGGTAGTGNGTGTDAGAAAQGQGQQTAGQGQGQGQGATTGGAGGALPAGYAVITEPGFHFSMAMPEGFKRTGTAGDNSGGIFSRDGGFPRIQVDFTGKPGDDAALAWVKLAPAVGSSSKGYRQIRIDKAEYRGYPTVADWEFEREQGGTKVRVLNRGFKIDATHGYAIMISCPADQWDGPECTQMRNVAFQTFQPLG